jgi:hypothetical protein
VNSSANFPCGSEDCYKDGNGNDGSLRVNCSNSAYYEINLSTMSCPEKNCPDREVLNNDSFPC